jgi:hypothetical protein
VRKKDYDWSVGLVYDPRGLPRVTTTERFTHLNSHGIELGLFSPRTMATGYSTTTTIPSTFSIPIDEKLSKANYCLWHAQIMLPIHTAKLEDVLTVPVSTRCWPRQSR